MSPPALLTLSELLESSPEVRWSYLVFCLCGYIVYLIVRRLVIWPFILSPLRKIPGPPIQNIILGEAHSLATSEPDMPLLGWVKKYGPVVRILGPVGVERMMFLEPEVLHQILVRDWLQYPRAAYARKILGIITGYGLLTVTGDEHKQMRKAMNPAFSIPNLMAQTHMYWESIDGFIDILKSEIGVDGEVLHVYNWLSKVTLDIICETAFGYKADNLHNPHNELSEAYEKIVSLQSGSNFARLIFIVTMPGGSRLLASEWAYRNHKVFDYLPFCAGASTLVESMHKIRELSKKMLEDKLQEAVHASDIDAKRDIMSILVRARKAEKEGNSEYYAMNDQAMMDQVLTFLGAGHETTASGLTWTLWLLANDKQSQQKLREEIIPIFSENPHPDYRTLKDLEWLDCVIMESLRIMPPVPLTVRGVKETGVINGTIIPKGTLIYIPIRTVNTWKDAWGEDAEEFHPERWLNLPESYHPSFSMLSFIAGPHACIGKTMAIIEMKAILAGLIVNFGFDLGYEGQKAKPAAAITMKPTDGMPLRVRCVQRV